MLPILDLSAFFKYILLVYKQVLKWFIKSRKKWLVLAHPLRSVSVLYSRIASSDLLLIEIETLAPNNFNDHSYMVLNPHTKTHILQVNDF